MENPRFLTVTLTDANTNYSLWALLTVADPEFLDLPFTRARRLTIQADFDAGAATFSIGNADMTATNYGAKLVGGQSVLYEDEQDTIILDHVYIRCDAAAQPIHVGVQFR